MQGKLKVPYYVELVKMKRKLCEQASNIFTNKQYVCKQAKNQTFSSKKTSSGEKEQIKMS